MNRAAGEALARQQSIEEGKPGDKPVLRAASNVGSVQSQELAIMCGNKLHTELS